MSLKTVLVGCGAISSKHIAAIAHCRESFELVGVFDIDAERAQAAARAARDSGAGDRCSSFTDIDAMAAALQPDAAAIATPSALHAEQAVFWMEHGCHLVLEKPVALSTSDIEQIARVKETTQRKIAVGYVLRYSSHIRLIERAVREGRFGRVFHVSLALYWNRNDEYYNSAPWRGTWANDGGSLMNQATHGIDLLQALAPGQPEVVYGRLARFLRPIEADDFAAATIRFDSGAVATLQSTVDTYPRNLGTRLLVLGEKGTAELSGNGPDAITQWRVDPTPGWESVDEQLKKGEIPEIAATPSGHTGVYSDLAQAIRDDVEPVTNLRQSSVSASIVLAILCSHKTGEEVGYPVDFSTSEMSDDDL